MADFIAVHKDGKEMMINLAWVVCVDQTKSGTAVICSREGAMTVDETYNAVKLAIWR